MVAHNPNLRPRPAIENFGTATARHCPPPVRERVARRKVLARRTLQVLTVPAHVLERSGFSTEQSRPHRIAQTQAGTNLGILLRTFRKTDA